MIIARRRTRYRVSFAVLAAAVGGFAQAPANSYVGSEPCQTCHPNQWATFYKNPHFKSLASGKGTPERTGCESCHGPGSEHLKAIASNSSSTTRPEPKKLSMERCAQCHSGFSEIQDPVPDDLLISSQVTALKRSQCYIQSGGGIGCTACHDPHRDAMKDDAKSGKACLLCHGTTVPDIADAHGASAHIYYSP